MIAMVNRNLKMFFRDKSAVFFSLLTVFIIIGLYVLFLWDMHVNGMDDMEGARFLMDSLIIAGVPSEQIMEFEDVMKQHIFQNNLMKSLFKLGVRL